MVLDVRKLTSIADFFVLCSTTSERQARAITEGLRERMEGLGRREMGLEGLSNGSWVLQDFSDVVVHLFHQDHREFYDLEGLWADARRIRWQGAAAAT